MALFVTLIYRDGGNRFLLGIPVGAQLWRAPGSGPGRGRRGHPSHGVLLLGLCQNIQIFANEAWLLL